MTTLSYLSDDQETRLPPPARPEWGEIRIERTESTTYTFGLQYNATPAGMSGRRRGRHRDGVGCRGVGSRHRGRQQDWDWGCAVGIAGLALLLRIRRVEVFGERGGRSQDRGRRGEERGLVRPQ